MRPLLTVVLGPGGEAGGELSSRPPFKLLETIRTSRRERSVAGRIDAVRRLIIAPWLLPRPSPSCSPFTRGFFYGHAETVPAWTSCSPRRLSHIRPSSWTRRPPHPLAMAGGEAFPLPVAPNPIGMARRFRERRSFPEWSKLRRRGDTRLGLSSSSRWLSAK